MRPVLLRAALALCCCCWYLKSAIASTGKPFILAPSKPVAKLICCDLADPCSWGDPWLPDGCCCGCSLVWAGQCGLLVAATMDAAVSWACAGAWVARFGYWTPCCCSWVSAVVWFEKAFAVAWAAFCSCCCLARAIFFWKNGMASG